MSIYVTGGAEQDDEIERLRARLAEAEALITLAAGFPMNRTPWQVIAEKLDAFLEGLNRKASPEP